MVSSTSKLYRRWWSMISRCVYPSAREYENYGGRGITVCYEWSNKNPQGFENFCIWMFAHGYDESLPHGAQTLDRINNDEGYSPENCRLISNKEQQLNKRVNVRITYKGETLCASEWAEKTGMSASGIAGRLYKGMSPEEIFETPLKPTNTKYEFSFRGKKYGSLTEVANEYGIKMKRLSYLIHKGYSIVEAIENELLYK